MRELLGAAYSTSEGVMVSKVSLLCDLIAEKLGGGCLFEGGHLFQNSQSGVGALINRRHFFELNKGDAYLNFYSTVIPF